MILGALLSNKYISALVKDSLLSNVKVPVHVPWTVMPTQPVITGLGTGTAIVNTFYYRRVGSDVEIKGSIQITAAGTGASPVELSNIIDQFPIESLPKNPEIPGGADRVVGYVESYQWQVAAQFKRLTLVESISTGKVRILKRDTNVSASGADILGGGAAFFIKYQVAGWAETQTLAEQLGI